MIWKLFKRSAASDDELFKRHFLAAKTVRIDGIPFVIKKINVLDYLEGAKVMAETFGVFKSKTETQGPQALAELDITNINKLKKYLTEIICAGVVKPKFSREENPQNGEIPIKELFTDWVLAQKLAQEIFDYTHGKKK